MKKILWLLMLVTFSISLVGCFGTDNDQGGKKPNDSKMKYDITYTNATLDTDSIDTMWISVIAEITNSGTADLYLSAGDVDLEDESGALVKSISLVSVYPQIISPGEKAYYYESTIIEGVSLDTELNVILHPSVEKSKLTKYSLPVSELKIINTEYFGVKATGRVENTSDKDHSLLYIAVIIFDHENKPIAVLTSLEDINSGVKKGFEASTLRISKNITAESISRFISHAYPFQFQF